MPELPEVETARRGIAPHIKGKTVSSVIVRDRRLRWPVSPKLASDLTGQRISDIDRRGKYLLFNTKRGTLLLHLGMSGSLRIVPKTRPPEKHDHVDIVFGCKALRYTDPRRFGSLLWTTRDPMRHRLIRDLGPEPLSDVFDAVHLQAAFAKRKAPVKALLMDSHIVVGVGNIYANEALFRAGINPKRAAGRIALPRLEKLVASVRAVLGDAIAAGGTTLRDFLVADGTPGYFQNKLDVYGREDEDCVNCGAPVRAIVIGQRATYYCPQCQR